MIKCKCWHNNHWVEFKLIPGKYKNLIDFLDSHKIKFLAESNIDFNKVPKNLQGRGNNKNLLDFLSNNNFNNELILDFFLYYLNNLIDIRYVSNNNKIIFKISDKTDWQKLTLVLYDEKGPKYLTMDNIYYSSDNNAITCDAEELL